VGVPDTTPDAVLSDKPAGREGEMEKEAAIPAPREGERLVMAWPTSYVVGTVSPVYERPDTGLATRAQGRRGEGAVDEKEH